MKPIIVSIVFACAFAWIQPPTAFAADAEQLLQSLRSAIRAEGGADGQNVPDDADEESKRRRLEAEACLQQLSPESLTSEKRSQTIRVLEQLMQKAGSQVVAESCASLLAELRMREAQEQTTQRENYEATVKAIFLKGVNATAARDLDELLRQLDELETAQNILPSSPQEEPRPINANTVAVVSQVLIAIQDVLLDIESPRAQPDIRWGSGSHKDHASKLNILSLSYNEVLSALLPRSEYLPKIQAIIERFTATSSSELKKEEFDKEVSEIVLNTRNLHDVGFALLKLADLSKRQSQINRSTDAVRFSMQVSYYQRIYDDVQDESPLSMRVAIANPFGNLVLNKIGDILNKAGLARHFKTFAGFDPREDETASSYFDRILKTAIQTSNWQVLSKVLEVGRYRNSYAALNTTDMLALQQFLVGLNFYNAREYSTAVASFTVALKTGSQIIPIARIADMLDMVKRDHLSDYQAGVENARTMESERPTPSAQSDILTSVPISPPPAVETVVPPTATPAAAYAPGEAPAVQDGKAR